MGPSSIGIQKKFSDLGGASDSVVRLKALTCSGGSISNTRAVGQEAGTHLIRYGFVPYGGAE